MLKIASLTVLASIVVSQPFFSLETDWKTLTEDSYSIEYPGDWELNQSGIMGVSFLLLSPLSSDEDAFRENVNLVIQDISSHNLDLDSYSELSTGQIETMITEGKLFSNERLKQNGQEFQKVVYSGKQGVYNLKFEQYYWVVNGNAYVLTLTCEINQFDAFSDMGEKILNSFKLN
ncbi:MAG: hypothetical protein K9G41_03945 [Flavobacteriales bacterium]|nr:hypothetical protein [Flavobacteriales bacterium]